MIRPLRARRRNVRPIWQKLFSAQARPLRFAITGGLAAVVQLLLLSLLTGHQWPALEANGVAFLLAAQFNFVVSNVFTWRDRPVSQSLARRWLAFHGSIASMAVINLLVFAIVRTALPDLLASAAGIGVASIGNFFIGDRLVFQSRHSDHAPKMPRLLQRLPA